MNSTVHPARQPSVAIVGGGPAGCYTAQFLRKAWPDSEIVIFDRLHVPHGLVRYGVAPDHPGTKAIAKQFDRLFERDGVRFVGKTIISSDPNTGNFSVSQLRAAFDVVVLATGLHADRPLGDAGNVLPGSQLNGVYGAGRLTRLINGHPHENVTDVHIGRHSVIVGQGNVAIDLLRLFLTPAERLRELGIAPEVVASITGAPVRRIDVVGRSLCSEAKFDIAMIRELGKLEDVRFEADQLEIGELPGAVETARRDAVATLVAGSDPTATRLVHFWFGWAPVALLGDDSVRAVVLRPVTGIVPGVVLRSALHSGVTTSQTIELVADSVCTAIGFTEHPDAPFRRIDHEEPEHSDLDRGVLGDDLYCVGWLRRGPRGTIPENRADARMVADTIVAQHLKTNTTTTKAGFAALPSRSASTNAELHLSKETS